MINTPIIVGGTKLPELTNPGTAGDLLAGKQLIDTNGNVLTGTLVTPDILNIDIPTENYTSNKALCLYSWTYFQEGFPYLCGSCRIRGTDGTVQHITLNDGLSGYGINLNGKTITFEYIYPISVQGFTQMGWLRAWLSSDGRLSDYIDSMQLWAL